MKKKLTWNLSIESITTIAPPGVLEEILSNHLGNSSTIRTGSEVRGGGEFNCCISYYNKCLNQTIKKFKNIAWYKQCVYYLLTVLILKFSNLIKIRSPHFCKPPNAPSSQVCFQMVVVSDKNTHVILKYFFHRILSYICSEWQHTHTQKNVKDHSVIIHIQFGFNQISNFWKIWFFSFSHMVLPVC